METYSKIFSLKNNLSLKRAVEISLVNDTSILFYHREPLNFEFTYDKCDISKTGIDIEKLKYKILIKIDPEDMVRSSILFQVMTLDKVLDRVKKARELYLKVNKDLNNDSISFLERASKKFLYSEKDIEDIKEISRSIAALDNSITIEKKHVAEGIQFKFIGSNYEHNYLVTPDI